MLKTFFFIALTFLFVLPAGARSYMLAHSDFVHLSDKEKDALIVKAMELVVEMEAKYRHETEKYGYSQERFEKFQHFFSKVESLFFISSAHAQSKFVKKKLTWDQMAADFAKLSSYTRKKTAGNCIYAGWISQAYEKNGQSYCAHPDFIDGATAARHNKPNIAVESQGYPDPLPGSGCGKDDRKKIQCNPLIFGYKNAKDSSLFCVDANDGAHNSSFKCMQASLEIEKVDGADSKEERIKYLREHYSQNPKAFKEVWEFTYNLCVCEDTPKNFNPGYQGYMRPHRTCYGLMEMMASTALDCSSVETKLPLEDASVFKDLRKFIGDKKILTEEEADKQYTSFLQNEILKNSATEYNRLCKTNRSPTGDTDGKDLEGGTGGEDSKYTCNAAKCSLAKKEGEESETYSCEFDVTEKDKEEKVVFTEAPTEVPASAEDKELAITGLIGTEKVSLTCPLSDNSAPGGDDLSGAPTLTVTIKDSGAVIYKILAVITPENPGWSFKWSTEGHDKNLKIPKAWEAGKPTEEKKVEANASGKIPGTASDSEATEGEKKEEPEVAAPAGTQDPKEILQPRLASAYSVCGELTKPGETPQKQCVKVEPLNSGKPKAQGPMPNQMPMTPFRGSSDYSAGGMR